MSSSNVKLTAMRAWAAALKAYDDAWAPFQGKNANPPGPAEHERLAALGAEVDQTYERYLVLGWTDPGAA